MTEPGLAPTIDLDDFIARDYPRVVSAVRRICGPNVDAEDAVQDALVTLIRRSPQDARIESVAAWVTVVASNSARTTLRRAGTEERALRRTDAPPTASADADSDGSIDLDRVLSTLPDRQRTIATLFYVFDSSVAAIADAMSISEGTVKTQLSRARATLAATLGATASGTRDANGGSDE